MKKASHKKLQKEFEKVSFIYKMTINVNQLEEDKKYESARWKTLEEANIILDKENKKLKLENKIFKGNSEKSGNIPNAPNQDKPIQNLKSTKPIIQAKENKYSF